MLPANKGSILVELARVISFPPAIFTRNQVNTPTNKPIELLVIHDSLIFLSTVEIYFLSPCYKARKQYGKCPLFPKAVHASDNFIV